MTITLVYETHSTTLDNEAGIATGWLPGELSEEGLRQAVALGQRRRAVGVPLGESLGAGLPPGGAGSGAAG